MSGEILFRRAAFGGFNRDDVMQYISTMSIESGDKEKSERELSKAKTELAGLKDSVSTKDEKIKQLSAEIESLKSELNLKNTKLNALESEVEVKNTRLLSMQIELEAARKASANAAAPEPEQKPEPEPDPEPEIEPEQIPDVEEAKDENTLSAERLMQDSMAYAERYIHSASLVADGIKKGTLEKLKTAAAQLTQMRDTASQLAVSSEKFNLIIDKLSEDVDEAAKGFEQNDKTE